MAWWKARAAHDPYDSRVAFRLMDALERAGNRAGALHHAMTHQQLLREELEIEPGPEIQALVERLRREPAATPGSRKEAADRPAVRPPTEITAGTAPRDLRPVDLDAASRRRRTILYGAAAILAAAAIGGGIRLASGSGETGAVAGPTVADEIAQAVARELDRRERGDTASRLPQHRTRSIPAYELFLRGDDPALVRSDSAARRGLEYFRRAVALDSTYAAAWVGLARLTFRLSTDGPPDSLKKARAFVEVAVRKALALDDSLAEAHALLGVTRAKDYDFASAEEHFKHAISLEPSRARIREWFANFYLLTGRPVEALAEAQRALAVDPRSPSATAEVARALVANDRCDEALARLETIAALEPPLLRAVPIAAQCHGRAGRWAEAIALLRPRAESGDALILAMLGYMLARAGQRGEALSIQDSLRNRWRNGALGAYYLAFVPTALGDRDQAFTWLDRAYKDRSLTFYPGRRVGLTDAPFDDLRQDPRLGRFRARLGLQNR